MKFLEYAYEGFNYKVFVPSGYQPAKGVPLMVMLHGCGQTPDDFAVGTKMNDLAEQETFIVLYPAMNYIFNPLNPTAEFNVAGCWNWFLDNNQHRQGGEPQIISGMIQEVKDNYTIDSDKVYVAGFSAGGAMATILGVTYPDLFRGIGVCSGLAYDAVDVFLPTDPAAEAAQSVMFQGTSDAYQCGRNAYEEMGSLKRKMPVIVFHGICDTIVHPINGEQVMTQWAETNFLVEGGTGNVDDTPALVKADIVNGRSYTQHVYHDKSGSPLMELWMVDKLGHQWSGGDASGSFTDALGPDASSIIWSFFTRQGGL